MAKRSKGIFGTVGSLWRLTVMALAVLLLFAIYLNVTGQNGEDVAIEAPQPAEEPVATSEVAEPEPETIAPADEPAEGVGAAVDEAANAASEAAETAMDEAETAATDALDRAETEIGGVVDRMNESVNEALDGVELSDTVTDAVEEALADAEGQVEAGADMVRESLESALGGLLTSRTGDATSSSSQPTEEVSNDAVRLTDEPGRGERPFGELVVPGDAASYELINAFERDNGSIEFTVERTAEDGAAEMMTRLATCAPLAVGRIATGDGPRNDNPELERIALGTPEATIAAFVCGVFR